MNKKNYKIIMIFLAVPLLVFLGGFFIVQNNFGAKKADNNSQKKQEQVQIPDTKLKEEIATGTKNEHIKSSKLPENLKSKLLDKDTLTSAEPVKKSGFLHTLRAEGSEGNLYQLEENGQFENVYFIEEPENLKSQKNATIQGLEIEGEIVIEDATAPNLLGEEYRADALGTDTTLLILHNFSNLTFLNNSSGSDDSASQALMVQRATTNSDSVQNFYAENSYGNFGVNTTVTPTLTSAHNASTGCDINSIRTTAEAAATAAGYVPANYDHVVYLFPYMPTCSYYGLSWAGLGSWPGRYVWLNGALGSKTLAHELGHNLGAGHANSFDCDSNIIFEYATCTETDYGDYYDTMGWGYDHFNSAFKDYLGWMSGKIQTVSANGTYSVYPYENSDVNTKVLKIAKPDTGEYYYLEYRQALGFDSNLASGVTRGTIVHIGDETGNDTKLLDATPAIEANDWDYVAMTESDPFSDVQNGITIGQNYHDANMVNLTLNFIPVQPQASLTPVYRFWNTNGTHFYTASEAEKNNVIARWPNIYRYEGVAYYINSSNPDNNIPLYRLWNANGTHFYTANYQEAINATVRWPNTFRLEGVAYYVSSTGTPVYRFWNTNGTHFYTASEAEKNNVIARWPNQFRLEGVGYYYNN